MKYTLLFILSFLGSVAQSQTRVVTYSTVVNDTTYVTTIIPNELLKFEMQGTQYVDYSTTKAFKVGQGLKYASYASSFFAGFCGGMGERYLSKDGNWDTRSKRSHTWRDISIWSTAGTGVLYGAGVTLTRETKPKDILIEIVFSAASYYLGTRAGYAVGK